MSFRVLVNMITDKGLVFPAWTIQSEFCADHKGKLPSCEGHHVITPVDYTDLDLINKIVEVCDEYNTMVAGWGSAEISVKGVNCKSQFDREDE